MAYWYETSEGVAINLERLDRFSKEDLTSYASQFVYEIRFWILGDDEKKFYRKVFKTEVGRNLEFLDLVEALNHGNIRIVER